MWFREGFEGRVVVVLGRRRYERGGVVRAFLG